MKLKMLVSIAGADFSLSPKDVTDRFSGDEARRLIDAGFAVEVTDAPSVAETAAPPAAEKAVDRRAKEKR